MVFRLCGHCSTGPVGDCDQSNWRIKAPISPPRAKTSFDTTFSESISWTMFGDLSSEKPGSKYHIRCRKRLSRAENKACLSLLAVFIHRGSGLRQHTAALAGSMQHNDATAASKFVGRALRSDCKAPILPQKHRSPNIAICHGFSCP